MQLTPPVGLPVPVTGNPMPMTTNGQPGWRNPQNGSSYGSPYAMQNGGSNLPPQVLALLRAKQGYGGGPQQSGQFAPRPIPGQPAPQALNPQWQAVGAQLARMNAQLPQMNPMPLAGTQPVGSPVATLPPGATTQVPVQQVPVQGALPPQVAALQQYGAGGLSQGSFANPNIGRALVR